MCRIRTAPTSLAPAGRTPGLCLVLIPFKGLVERAGLEPATCRLYADCSSQLSYLSMRGENLTPRLGVVGLCCAAITLAASVCAPYTAPACLRLWCSKRRLDL